MQVASATIPTFMTCASICPNPATSARRPAPSGIRTPADRIIGLTTSPGRSKNCSTRPSTPARTKVLSRSTCASRQRRLGTCLLGREKRAHAHRGGLFCGRCGIDGALTAGDGHLEFLDVALRHDAGIALLQLALHIQFVGRLLQRALGFLKLAFRLQDIGLRRQLGGVDLGDLAPGRFQRRLLLRVVQPEDHVALLDRGAEINVDFRDPAVGFGKDRNGAIVQRRRSMSTGDSRRSS